MLNNRERRIGIIAGVLLGALALDRVVLSPLLDRLDSASSRVDAAQLALNDATQTMQMDQHVQRVWNDLAGSALLSNATDAEGQLLNRARQWADASRLSLQSLKPERSENQHGYQKITVRVTATGTMQQVSRFLYAVNTSQIPVMLSDMQLSPRKENTDDLTIAVALSTIYLPPAARMEVQR